MMMFLCQQPEADFEGLADFYVTFRIVNLDFRREKCENIAGCVAYIYDSRQDCYNDQNCYDYPKLDCENDSRWDS